MEIFCSLISGHSSTIITDFGYTDHRSISGQRFERVTFLRKFYSFWIRSTDWNLLRCLFLVSSSLTKPMNFGQAFLVDFSLSPAHIYGAICIVNVIKQPMCQICRTGQQVVHGPDKTIRLKRLIFPQHLSG